MTQEDNPSGLLIVRIRPYSRLSDNAAPDSPEVRPQLFVRDVDEGLPSSQGKEDARTHLRNPDIRVPRNTKRADGRGAREADEEEEEEEEDKRNAD
ncbi:hypothetical protein NDU88_007260 [Pleurodeles waltl]|uniref:Uncharacterized protein n=1 Tax=Pleurodeles waltl TaxID=8319 RepID=A0AAV7NWV6_PLEWA|nr:hypothetical protein NDU88_007260 [Pleurodeles waltl]